MKEEVILDFLSSHNQTELLTRVSKLPKKNKELLLEDISKYLKLYQRSIQSEEVPALSPLKECMKANLKSHELVGIDSVKKQEVGCMVLAAGEGSRFGTCKAKGLFCIDKDNTLISNLCQWVLAYELAFNIKIPLFFLVSSKNKKEIVDHFEENKFFQLDQKNIFFIEQANYPLLNEQHQWFLDSENKVANAPNGNGDFLDALQRSSAWGVLKKLNIKYLQVLFIDNPLIDPLDPNLLGFLIDQKLDAALHVFERDDVTEKVGVICEAEGRDFVVDYMQIEKDFFAKVENNKPIFSYANSGHFCVSVDALISLANRKIELSYHWVWKKTNDQTYAWKAEKFAFDIFLHLNCKSLCYEKSKTFAPLKTMHDIENVRNTLEKRNYRIYRDVYRKDPNSRVILKIKDIVNYLKKKSLT